MRRQILVVVAVVFFTAMLASMTRAQLFRRSPQPDSKNRAVANPNSNANANSNPNANSGAPVSRSVRYALRNGLDYIRYREYERALKFLNEADTRKAELTQVEREMLTEALNQARESLASASSNPNPNPNPIGGELTTERPRDPGAIRVSANGNARGENGPARSERSARSSESVMLPPLPRPEPIDATDVSVTQFQDPVAPTPELVTPDQPAAASKDADLPPLPGTVEAPPASTAPPGPKVSSDSGANELPPLPGEVGQTPTLTPAPEPTSAPAGSVAARENNAAPAPPPARTLDLTPPEPPRTGEPIALNPDAPPASSANPKPNSGSRLPDSIMRDVERIARQQRDSTAGDAGSTESSSSSSDAESSASDDAASSQQLFQPRPPSPTEPRPIRGITTPDEFVAHTPRQWEPYRKYWAAAATCHAQLYFEDPILERYGQSMETKLGHAGHYLSYPIDDPKQSNQRAQIVQPFFSFALMGKQIATLPIKMVLDPPWEAEYDLGFFRPGDRVPPDLFYFPWTGMGPPFAGSHY